MWFPAALGLSQDLPAAVLMGGEMESIIPISLRAARFWEAQRTLRELGNQAEDSFPLNHSKQNAPSAYS